MLSVNLEAAEQRQRAILDGAADFAIITLDLDGRISGWNSGARDILGWEEAEVLAQDAGLFWTAADRAAGLPRQEMQTAREKGRAVDERWHLKRDGSLFWASGVLRPLHEPGGRIVGYIKVLRDQTERREAELASRESELRFRILAEGIPQLVFRSRSSGERTWGSPQWVAYADMSEQDSLGLGWLDAIHPDDRAPTMAAWAQAEAQGLYAVEHRVRHRASGTYHWFQTRATPVRDDSTRIIEWLGTSTDIDEQIRVREALSRSREELEIQVAARTAELVNALGSLRTETADRQHAEEALRQSQKMEAVGQLTGGIAHDFNNMLQAIAGGLEIAQQRLEQERFPDVGRYLMRSRAAVDRAAALTHRLLAFARRQHLDPKPVDPDGLIASMADLIRRTMGPGIQVELRLRDGAWWVRCDPNELESTLLNLCINARDAMPESGRLTIGTDDARLSSADVAGEDVAPGNYVVISVTDTGEGIPPEVLGHVFEPFYTTKPLGQGTGLGLSQVYGFVRQSGGMVRIDSALGQWTTVRLFMPRHEPEAETAQQTAAPSSAASNVGETVLLVDDEQDVRELTAERLRQLGYRIIEAADGPSALRLLQGRLRPDLLITDVGLPGGMNGRQLAEASREHVPDMPVLFITGYANISLPPGFEVITKPFNFADLVTRVQDLLKASRLPLAKADRRSAG